MLPPHFPQTIQIKEYLLPPLRSTVLQNEEEKQVLKNVWH